ncbi:MAG TPA: hypothetical protein V6C72_08365 [Chroococcales cyanobacterium]
MVQTVESSEPIWKGFISLNFFFAVVTVGVFAYLVYAANLGGMVESGENQGLSQEEAALCSESVLKEIDESEPVKLLRAGKDDDAFAAANSVYNADRYNAKNCAIAGNVYAASDDKGMRDKGWGFLRKSIYLSPRSRFLRLNYARQLVKLERLEEAASEYSELTQKFPKWGLAWLELAQVDESLHNAKEAEAAAAKAIKIEPENPEALKLLAIAQADVGIDAKDDAKIKTGFENYSKAFEFERTEKYPLQERDLVIANSGSIEKSIAELRKKLAGKKDDVDSTVALADLLIYQNQAQEAKDVLLDAEKKAPHNPRILRLKAEVLHLLNDREGAFTSFKSAASFDSDAAGT